MPIGLITGALKTVGEAAIESVSDVLRDTEVIGVSQNDINTLLERVNGISLGKKKSNISFTGIYQKRSIENAK